MPEAGAETILIAGWIRFGPGEIARLASAMIENIRYVRGRDGCEDYAYSVALDDPDMMRIAARWRDEAALAAHMQSDRFPAMLALIEAAVILEMHLPAYQARLARMVLADPGPGLPNA